MAATKASKAMVRLIYDLLDNYVDSKAVSMCPNDDFTRSSDCLQYQSINPLPLSKFRKNNLKTYKIQYNF